MKAPFAEHGKRGLHREKDESADVDNHVDVDGKGLIEGPRRERPEITRPEADERGRPQLQTDEQVRGGV